jgi:cyclopropane-fatty-acyl-phospholipid synthase
MLDRRLAYSCGYWRSASNLDDAQEAKLDLVCRKLGLRPGMRLLDIGCGWGSLVRHATERYGVRAVGVTVSDEQVAYARDACRGLDVEVRLQDYRELNEEFDRIASIGMFEHVGPKNYRAFMCVARRCLAEDGLFLLHTIGTRDSFPNLTRSELDWVERNIFPGAVMQSMKQIGAALDGVFVTEDLENFGADYAPTLMAWHANFEEAWSILAPRYGERFRRMWRYYLLTCAGAFRARAYQVWQLALSPRGMTGCFSRPSPIDSARGAGR